MTDITPLAIDQFHVWLKKSDYQQNYHLMVLRAFLKWCAKYDIEAMNPDKIETMDLATKEREPLTKQEVDQLFASLRSDTAIEKRNKAIIMMLYVTGLRLSELGSLNRMTIDFETKRFQVLGKGRKYRTVFLDAKTIEALQDYFRTRLDDFPPLFIHYSHRPCANSRLSNVMIEKIVREQAKKAGISKKLTPHVLRHTFATHLYLNGVDIKSIKEMMGHKSIITTDIYCHVTVHQLQQMHEKHLTIT